MIKVVDDPDPALSAPSIGISNTEEIIDQSETVTIEGCASAQEGSTLTAYWALPAGEVTWQAFVEGEPVRGEIFTVVFDPPAEAVGQGVMIRVDITDPSGRSYTHYMRDLVYVLGDPYPPECEGNVFDPNCGEAGTSGGSESGDVGSTSDAETSSTGGTSVAQDDPSNERTGGCGMQRPGSIYASALLLMGLAGLRRRR